MTDKNSSTVDEARALLDASAEKIDQSLVKENKEAVSIVAMEKMLRVMDEHGAKGVKSVRFLPNWNEGATPAHLPTGLVMLFDLNSARVVPDAFPVDAMYGGTTAYRIPDALLAGSPLTPNGKNETSAQLVKRISAIDINNNLDDAYIGVYENKQRGEFTVEHAYWVVTRSVAPELNVDFGAELKAHKDQRLVEFLNSTKSLRHNLFEKQREARANKIVQLLGALGIRGSVDARGIVESGGDSYIDHACFSINDQSAKNEAALYSDAVNIASTSNVFTNGLVLSGSVLLGPRILRGNAHSRVTKEQLSAFPSSTGTQLPVWEASKWPNTLKLGEHSRMSAVNRWVWTAGANSSAIEHHPLLALNAFRSCNSSWLRLEQAAGFVNDKSLALDPVAVKLTAAAITASD